MHDFDKSWERSERRSNLFFRIVLTLIVVCWIGALASVAIFVVAGVKVASLGPDGIAQAAGRAAAAFERARDGQ